MAADARIGRGAGVVDRTSTRESLLQQFAEFILRAGLFPQRRPPLAVMWVRRVLSRPATTDFLDIQLAAFSEDLEGEGRHDWQVTQAERAVRVYFVNFLKIDDARWRTPLHGAAAVVDPEARVDSIAALRSPRTRIRTRPASTQSQARSAVLFLCGDLLTLPVNDLTLVPRPERGARLPAVLSVPGVAALLDHLRGTPHLMAAPIYRGGLLVSECCGLRIRDMSTGSSVPAMTLKTPRPRGCRVRKGTS